MEEALGCQGWQELSCWGERLTGDSLPFSLEMCGDLSGLGTLRGQGPAESQGRRRAVGS